MRVVLTNQTGKYFERIITIPRQSFFKQHFVLSNRFVSGVVYMNLAKTYCIIVEKEKVVSD